MDWAAGGSYDWKQRHEKQITAIPNLDYSPYYYAKVRGYDHITLLKRVYSVSVDGTILSLRDALNTTSAALLDEQDKEIMGEVSAGEQDLLFMWNSSLDFSLYNPIGQYPTCNLHDKAEYIGQANFAGTLIYEGYYIPDPTTGNMYSRPVDEQGLNELYGGPDRFHLESEYLVVERQVYFMFTRLKMANKAGPLFNYCFPREPGIEYQGTIEEHYLISKEA